MKMMLAEQPMKTIERLQISFIGKAIEGFGQFHVFLCKLQHDHLCMLGPAFVFWVGFKLGEDVRDVGHATNLEEANREVHERRCNLPRARLLQLSTHVTCFSRFELVACTAITSSAVDEKKTDADSTRGLRFGSTPSTAYDEHC